jgi:flagellar motor switch protein FliG
MATWTAGGGLRKAAILMVSLDPESAAKVMAEFEKPEQERLAREIVRLEGAPAEPAELEVVIREFLSHHRARAAGGPGGVGAARRILEKIHTPEETREMLRAVENALGRTRFEFLRKAELPDLVAFLANEHPQTIALVLSHLPAEQGARLVQALPLPKQQEVVRRLASLEPTNPAVVEQVEKTLESRLSAYGTRGVRETDGLGAAAALLARLPRSTERGLIEALRADDPEFADSLRRRMFRFELLLRANDRGIQNLLKNVDAPTLSLALKTAGPELRDKFFRNMSPRAAERIREEMEVMGPVRLSEVESAQQGIVDEVLRLEESGELVIEGRGGADTVVG